MPNLAIRLGTGADAAQLAAELARLHPGIALAVDVPPTLDIAALASVLARHGRALRAIVEPSAAAPTPIAADPIPEGLAGPLPELADARVLLAKLARTDDQPIGRIRAFLRGAA